MEQLSLLQTEKQVTEENLATQLALTKEELMSVKADCDRLKQELSIANDKLSEFEIIIVQFSVCCMC